MNVDIVILYLGKYIYHDVILIRDVEFVHYRRLCG